MPGGETLIAPGLSAIFITSKLKVPRMQVAVMVRLGLGLLHPLPNNIASSCSAVSPASRSNAFTVQDRIHVETLTDFTGLGYGIKIMGDWTCKGETLQR